jgi:nitronate monooxygenase
VSEHTRREFIGTTVAAGAAFAFSCAQASDASPVTTVIAMPTHRSKELMTLFGLKYPIFEAPHGPRNTSPELAIAVSKAGAMGALALTYHTPDNAHEAVSKVRAATKGAFFVNYILAFPFADSAASLQAALDAGAPAVQFSWGLPPKEAISTIRAAGAKLGMQVTSRESAKVALDLGADYLVCQGTEAGGHVQASRGLYEALPNVLEEAKQKPVIASGGIGDGAGIRKALLAGASAAMLGTRFVADDREQWTPSSQAGNPRGSRPRHCANRLFLGWLARYTSRFTKSHLHLVGCCGMPATWQEARGRRHCRNYTGWKQGSSLRLPIAL